MKFIWPIIFLVVLFALGAYHTQKYIVFKQSGVETIGRIVSVTGSDAPRRLRHTVTIMFKTEGNTEITFQQKYSTVIDVFRKILMGKKTYEKEKSISIVYLPDDPYKAHIADFSHSSLIPAIASFFFGGLLFVIFLYGFLKKSRSN